MAKMMRCTAELQIAVTGSSEILQLWPGLEVDLDRELAPGHTIADAIKGREDCFEDVDTTPSRTPHATKSAHARGHR